MRLTTTIVRSWSATFVGTFFTGVTSWVLCEDVFRHGAPFTTKHLMTLAVLAGTVYFGHRVHIELRSWRLGWALGCAVLFLGGTAFCVSMSAGRNAEALTVKALAASSVNSGREAAQKDRDEARVRYHAAMKAEEAECGSGQGDKCWGKRTTTKLRREDYDSAERMLRQQQPEQVANGDVKSAAQLFSRLPLVTADASSIEALLLLLNPFLQSLFCEVAAIVGFGMGIGHKRGKTEPNRDSSVQSTVQFAKPRRKTELNGLSSSTVKTMARIDLVGYIETHGALPNQDLLVERWRKSKGTISCWLADWEREGLISRQRDGKCKIAKLN